MNGLFMDEYDINQARLNRARELYPDMNITMQVNVSDNRIILLEIRHNDSKFDYVYKQMLDYDANDDRIDMAIGYGVERVRMHMGVKNVIDPVYIFDNPDDKS